MTTPSPNDPPTAGQALGGVRRASGRVGPPSAAPVSSAPPAPTSSAASERPRPADDRPAAGRQAEPVVRGAFEELDVLIRARYPIIYVVSWEEERIEQYLAEISARRKKKLHIWTLTQGLVQYGSEPQRTKTGAGAEPIGALDGVLDHIEPAIFLFKDFHPFMDDNRSNLMIVRRLRDVAYRLRDTYKTIVIVSPMMRIAPSSPRTSPCSSSGCRACRISNCCSTASSATSRTSRASPSICPAIPATGCCVPPRG